jgi:ATP-dependent Lon protease
VAHKTRNEKINKIQSNFKKKTKRVCKNFSPQVSEMTGLSVEKGDIQISDEGLNKLIRMYCRESGVRNLRKQVSVLGIPRLVKCFSNKILLAQGSGKGFLPENTDNRTTGTISYSPGIILNASSVRITASAMEQQIHGRFWEKTKGNIYLTIIVYIFGLNGTKKLH